MAIQDDSVTSGKKSGDAFDDLPMFNVENLQSNLKIINHRMTLDGLLGGLMSFVQFWTFAYDIVHIF